MPINKSPLPTPTWQRTPNQVANPITPQTSIQVPQPGTGNASVPMYAQKPLPQLPAHPVPGGYGYPQVNPGLTIPGPVQRQIMPSPQQLPMAPTRPQGGPDKWALDGFHTLKQHVDDENRQWLVDNQSKLLLDSKTKNLLVTSSSFEPGSKPLDQIVQHLKNRIDAIK